MFMALDVGRLRALRDNAFDEAIKLEGAIVSSSVNGASFTLDFKDIKLAPDDIATLAQMALDAKARGFQRPITRTVALFN
jgi:hypothetical protein